jgi:hypothetical protein
MKGFLFLALPLDPNKINSKMKIINALAIVQIVLIKLKSNFSKDEIICQ